MKIYKSFCSRLKIFSTLTIAATLLFAPDVLLDLTSSVIVGLFESLEYFLDKIVEHLFNTSRHTTQIIVFYLMWMLLIFLIYKSVRAAKQQLDLIKNRLPLWWRFHVNEIKTRWYIQPLQKKIRVIFGCCLGTFCFGYLML